MEAEQPVEGTMKKRVSSGDTESLRCRFYEQQYPETDEVVVVNVTDIGEMGAYVTLLEYDNIEGMILLSELSRKRIRSINKLVRINRNEVVMVLRVDKEKGYIDLSKRRVAPEDVAKCEDRFNKAKAVHSVLRHVADQNGLTLESLYQMVGWPLYKKYGHAYDAFKLALTNDTNEDIFDGIDIAGNISGDSEDIDAKKLKAEQIKADLLSYVKRRLAPQPVKIRADIEVTCFTYDGIDAIKESLLEGENTGTNESVVIKLIAPPMYVMTTITLDREQGIQTLTTAIEKIATLIRSKGGTLDVKMAPKAITDREESEMQAMLDRLALEQEEVDGDAPEDA